MINVVASQGEWMDDVLERWNRFNAHLHILFTDTQAVFMKQILTY